jgi:DNA-binding XRE family transcriptional regulator
MYANLYKEMKLRKVTQTEVSKMLGLSNQTICDKINGGAEFKSTEMFSIKEHFFPDLTLEYLFAKE